MMEKERKGKEEKNGVEMVKRGGEVKIKVINVL
jgi:hypothetical protein